jgi:hypothetical protein
VKNRDASRSFSYTPLTSGFHNLVISCRGAAQIILKVNVTPLANADDMKEIGGYAFRFKANEFSSNETV